jgi:hypothetical protein
VAGSTHQFEDVRARSHRREPSSRASPSDEVEVLYVIYRRVRNGWSASRKGWPPTGDDIVDLLRQFADRLGSTDAGRRFGGVFDAAIQFRWVPTPVDPAELAWFGTLLGTWPA